MLCNDKEGDGDGLREEEADRAGMDYKTSWHAGRQQVQLPTKMSTGRRSALACSASLFFFMSSCAVHMHTVAVIVEADSNNKHCGTLPKGAMSVMLCSIVRLEKEEESL